MCISACVHVQVHTCHDVHMIREQLQESIFSFCHMGPSWAPLPTGKHLCLLSHLPSLEEPSLSMAFLDLGCLVKTVTEEAGHGGS